MTLSYSMQLKRYHGSFFLLWSCGVVNFSLRRRRRPRGHSLARRVKQRPCKMMAGPFKLPNKAEAEAEKKKRVSDSGPEPLARLASGTLASNFLKSSPLHTAIRPTDTRLTSLPSASRFLKAAIKQVKEWVESYIPPEHLANHTCVVDVSEVRAPRIPKAPPADISRLSRRETRSPRVSPRRRPRVPDHAHPRSPSPT